MIRSIAVRSTTSSSAEVIVAAASIIRGLRDLSPRAGFGPARVRARRTRRASGLMNVAMPSSTPANHPRGRSGGVPKKRTTAHTANARPTGSRVEPSVKRMSGEAKTATSHPRKRARARSPAPSAAMPAVLSRSTPTMNRETSSVNRWNRSTRRASSGAKAAAPPCARPSTSGLVSPRNAVDRGPAHILAEADGCSYPELRHGPCRARARKVVMPRTAASAVACALANRRPATPR